MEPFKQGGGFCDVLREKGKDWTIPNQINKGDRYGPRETAGMRGRGQGGTAIGIGGWQAGKTEDNGHHHLRPGIQAPPESGALKNKIIAALRHKIILRYKK